MKYTAEIYSPGSTSEVVAQIHANGPFQTFNPGDLIDPRGIDSPLADDLRAKFLRVRRVIHWLFVNGDDVTHKLGIITESVPQTPEEALR
jgi:hypothetical protein